MPANHYSGHTMIATKALVLLILTGTVIASVACASISSQESSETEV
jgi:hypothetical protein